MVERLTRVCLTHEIIVVPLLTSTSRWEHMQQLLNKSVISVRDGLLTPDDATRTILECAVLLGLEVAADDGGFIINNTTVLLKGMVKTTTASDIRQSFGGKFGPMESVAVATGNKGFGMCVFVIRM